MKTLSGFPTKTLKLFYSNIIALPHLKNIFAKPITSLFFVMQGVLFSTPECIKTPVDLVKLWLHEASRVYGDKLIETKDMEMFQKMKLEIAKAGFEVSL